MASEAQLADAKNKTNQSPVALKNLLLKEHIQTQNQTFSARAKAVAKAEQISVKFTTNKDMYMGFDVETVSDAFTYVELKKVTREI
jgi:hypothetical protein